MKSLQVRIAIGALAVLTAVAASYAVLIERTVPDASAQPRSGDVELARVFETVSLRQPVWMQQAPGAPERWFVVEQPGRIVTFLDSTVRQNKEVALDLTDRVRSGGERGLLGLAFHPKYAQNRQIFVNYTADEGGQLHTRVSRFTRGEDATRFDPASEKILLKVDQPYGNHNGGQVAFGPDGYLYVGYGDGGSGGDPQGHGQNTKTLLGSIVRIDVDGGDPYSIPADNPFAKGGGAREVFAWGLRNPWRFSFDRKTGDLWAGDVGQNAWEEIDVIVRGGNYGWNVLEGTHCYPPKLRGECSSKAPLIAPVVEHSQDDGDKSITGGYVYRGKKWRSRIGHYVYGDFVSGRVYAFDPATKSSRVLLDSGLNIASFVEAADGELGVLDYQGRIFHLRGDDQRQ